MGGMIERSTPPVRGAVIPVLRIAALVLLASAPGMLCPGRSAAGEGAAAGQQGAVAAERTATAQDVVAELISGVARGLGDQRDMPAEGVGAPSTPCSGRSTGWRPARLPTRGCCA